MNNLHMRPLELSQDLQIQVGFLVACQLGSRLQSARGLSLVSGSLTAFRGTCAHAGEVSVICHFSCPLESGLCD